MIGIRIDDIGASTKHFNQYGKKTFRFRGFPYFYFPFANLGFFKRIPPFRGWAVYDELTAGEWQDFFVLFREFGVKPIIAITATWVEKDGTLTPFPEKFPEEAAALKQAAKEGLVTIASHGLTHCVVGKHLPQFAAPNRQFHREFWDWVPADVQREHILRSQEILETYFEMPIEILVPPGNVWCKSTYEALKGTNIKTVLCNRYMRDSTEPMEGITFIDDRQGYWNIHDRELKRYGKKWLLKQLQSYANRNL